MQLAYDLTRTKTADSLADAILILNEIIIMIILYLIVSSN